MEDDWDRRIDRRFEELENLLKELAAQRGLSIAPRTGPIQSSEGNSGGGPDDRTLFVKIHSMEYRISCDVLELVFSRFGILEDVEILDSGSEFHSRIRFRDRDSAIKALEYDGRDIYDGCCRMELFLDRICEKANEMGAPIEDRPVEKFENVDPSRALKVFEEIPNSQVQDRTLLVKIHLMQYSISCRELDLVFSRFGAIEKLEVLSPRSEFHSRICFQNIKSACMAFDSLNHRNIYDGCCELELFFLRDIMIEPANSHSTITEDTQHVKNVCSPEIVGIQEFGCFSSSVQETRDIDTGEDDRIPELLSEKSKRQENDNVGMNNFDANVSVEEELAPKSVEGNAIIGVFEDLEIEDGSSGSMSTLLTDDVEEIEPKKMVVSVAELINHGEIRLGDSKRNLFDFLVIPAAQQLFDKMPLRSVKGSDCYAPVSSAQLQLGNRVFDPGDTDYEYYGADEDPKELQELETFGSNVQEAQDKNTIEDNKISELAYEDVSKFNLGMENLDANITILEELKSDNALAVSKEIESKLLLGVMRDFRRSTDATSSFVFDPGGASGAGILCVESPIAVTLIVCCWDMDALIFVFDPGGQ